jgi:hypothetical protein
MTDGRNISSNRLTVHVDDPGTMPAIPSKVMLWGEDSKLTGWLTKHGVTPIPFNPLAASRQLIVVGAKAPAPGGKEAFAQLFRHSARGSAVVFLDRTVFAEGKDAARWLPLAGKKFAEADWIGSFFRAERWSKRHPIFQGLPSGGMMDYSYYGSLLNNVIIPSNEEIGVPAASDSGLTLKEVISGATRTSSSSANREFISGLQVALYGLNEGRFMLNTLSIMPNLDQHPAAERLLRNMLNYAARDLDKPLAELPADFDTQLRAMGYKQ